MSSPSVSYLVPVLNEASRLAEAVRAALGQDYAGEQEVVVAVAPSSDGTEEVAASRVKVQDDAFEAPVWLVVLLAAVGIAGVVTLLILSQRPEPEEVAP